MHRFAWDLRYERPKGVRQGYPISAIAGYTPAEPRGPLALPGDYAVRLTVDGHTYTRAPSREDGSARHHLGGGPAHAVRLSMRIKACLDRRDEVTTPEFRRITQQLEGLYRELQGSDQPPQPGVVRRTEERLAAAAKLLWGELGDAAPPLPATAEPDAQREVGGRAVRRDVLLKAHVPQPRRVPPSRWRRRPGSRRAVHRPGRRCRGVAAWTRRVLDHGAHPGCEVRSDRRGHEPPGAPHQRASSGPTRAVEPPSMPWRCQRVHDMRPRAMSATSSRSPSGPVLRPTGSGPRPAGSPAAFRRGTAQASTWRTGARPRGPWCAGGCPEGPCHGGPTRRCP